MTSKERERRIVGIILKMNSDELRVVKDLPRLVASAGARKLIVEHLMKNL